MPDPIKISLISFLFFCMVSCNQKAGSKLSHLDISLVKGFVGDTIYYKHAYFKCRIFNRNRETIHLYIEKYQPPFITPNVSGQKKTGSFFMLDENRNRANELLSTLVPNELIIKANRSFIFFLRSPLAGLVSQGEGTTAGFQRVLAERIKNRLYSYYSLDGNGAIDDSAAIRVDSNFLIEYREPLVTD